jgi:hypothetical protein
MNGSLKYALNFPKVIIAKHQQKKTQMRGRQILFLIVVGLIIWYIGYYFRPPKHVAILQTSLAEFTLDLLIQRQPIVFSDAVADWRQLRTAWFAYHRVEEGEGAKEPSTEWTRNRYKYLLLQPHQDSEILLYPAFKKLNKEGRPPEDETLLAIKLKAHQIVVLPYRWFFYMPETVPYGWMGAHDYITRWLPAA